MFTDTEQPEEQAYTSPICPFLGQSWDQTVSFGYPHISNYCYKPKKAQPVSIVHQGQVCINGKYWECPVFASFWNGELPPGIRGEVANGRKINSKVIIASIFLLALFTAAAAFWGFGRSGHSSAAQINPTVEERSTNMPSISPDGPTLTSTASPRLTAARTITPVIIKPIDPVTATVISTSTEKPCFKLLTPADGAQMARRGKTTFSWEAFPGAARYRLEFISPTNSIVAFNTVLPSNDRFPESLPWGGLYHWQVVGLDADGKELCTTSQFTFTKTLTQPADTPVPTEAEGGGGGGKKGGGNASGG